MLEEWLAKQKDRSGLVPTKVRYRTKKGKMAEAIRYVRPDKDRGGKRRGKKTDGRGGKRVADGDTDSIRRAQREIEEEARADNLAIRRGEKEVPWHESLQVKTKITEVHVDTQSSPAIRYQGDDKILFKIDRGTHFLVHNPRSNSTYKFTRERDADQYLHHQFIHEGEI